MKVDVRAWLAKVRQAQPHETWRGLSLWFELHESPARQRQLGTNHQELIGFLQAYAKHLRLQIACGKLEEALMFWRAMQYGGPWEYLGISVQEAREWLCQWARQLYGAMSTHPENAAHILTLSGWSDADWVRVFGTHDSQQLAQKAITWARQSYAYLQQPDIDAGPALDRVGQLLVAFVGTRHYWEVMHAETVGPHLSIYPHLGFSYQALGKLYAALLSKARR